MKVRQGFVTNSSSSNFVIVNTSDQKKTLVDFIKENPQFAHQGWDCSFSHETLLRCAEQEGITFDPGEDLLLEFGDEGGGALGLTLEQALRDGGSSESFEWRFHESLH